MIGAARDRAGEIRLVHDRPTEVAVAANTRPREAGAGLRLQWATHSPVVAPVWSGTITGLSIEPGDQAHDGQIAVEIDGIDRMFVTSPRPFSQPLAPGATGVDAEALNDLLRRRGLEASPGATFGPATARGVVAFSRSIGAAPSFVFDPGWVLFLSNDGAQVDELWGTVGAPAPSAGDVVATLTPELVGADVVEHQNAPPEVPASKEGAASASSPSGDPMPEGASSKALAGLAPVEVPAGASLRIDETELALADERTRVATRSLPAVEAIVAPEAPYADASFSTPPGQHELLVPAAAVIADQQGTTCLQVIADDRRRAEIVLVIGGDAGQSVVVPADPSGVGPGDRVRVRAPAGERSCR